ncbi:MAG: GtrA family protein [Candidatus Pacebacteria bacterium]|nr:GtrA family protein [Candidatus Paceibacterota bacterium]
MRNKKSAIQFSKFVFVGAMNTLIDLGVLNLLVAVLGLSKESPRFVFLKSASFLAAVTFSYFCNKYFVFKTRDNGRKEMKKEGLKFFSVSLAGFVLNVTAASATFFFLTQVAESRVPINILANLSALTGSLFTMFWNFFGYKFWVFKKK